MSTLKTNVIQTVSGKPILQSTGSILQVIHTELTTSFEATSTGRINMYGASTYRMSQLSGVHYDSPSSTSALTYQIALGGYSGSPIVYVNRSEAYQVTANDFDFTPVSTLTLMEVSA